MFRIKLLVVFVFSIVIMAACVAGGAQKNYVIADSQSYEASLYRQNCAICHGAEGEGKTLADGRVVPSLRSGNFKMRTSDAIYKQIADGGNGMLPFRRALTERELKMMTDFVQKDLRGN